MMDNIKENVKQWDNKQEVADYLMKMLNKNAEDSSPENLVNQALNLIAKFPTIIAYSYHSMRHFYQHKTLSIRHPNPTLSTAENFLLMMKGEGKYTQLEADILDLALILHADHGGGNNSTFTIRVTSSTGTDTYSVCCICNSITKRAIAWRSKPRGTLYDG